MKIQGAVLNPQGESFAVVRIEGKLIHDADEANKAIHSLSNLFPEMPIVIAAEESRGRFTYYGRPDISHLVASTSLSNIDWREYTLAEGLGVGHRQA